MFVAPRPVTMVLAGLACSLLSTASAADPAPNCSAAVARPWTQAGQGWTVEALASGPDCARAAAMIVVRDPEGIPQWTAAYRAEHVAVLAGQSSPDGLRAQMNDWIDTQASTLGTGADLPDWAAGTDGPTGEFPFIPAEGMDRETYLQIRNSETPLFCYVQGLESLNCVALDKDSGTVSSVGFQTFPG